MSCEVSETLEKLAAEHQCATTQKERDRVWQGIIRVSYRQESDREREWRRTRQGEFESSMPSLDAQVEKFDDPGKIAAFSDGGAGAANVRSCGGCGGGSVGGVAPGVKKRLLNKLRRHPHLQKTLRRFIKNATSKKQTPVKKTHIKKICEILF